jgi:hypothetical protein
MKSRGANIFCSVCHAEPWPGDPAIRETFDLARVGDDWFCERCRPVAQKRAPRLVASSPAEATNEFERTLAAELARPEEAVGDDISEAVEACRAELERALAELRKALLPQKAPPPDDAPRGRSPKKIKATERLGDGQRDWVGDAQPEREDSP